MAYYPEDIHRGQGCETLYANLRTKHKSSKMSNCILTKLMNNKPDYIQSQSYYQRALSEDGKMGWAGNTPPERISKIYHKTKHGLKLFFCKSLVSILLHVTGAGRRNERKSLVKSPVTQTLRSQRAISQRHSTALFGGKLIRVTHYTSDEHNHFDSPHQPCVLWLSGLMALPLLNTAKNRTVPAEERSRKCFCPMNQPFLPFCRCVFTCY